MSSFLHVTIYLQFLFLFMLILSLYLNIYVGFTEMHEVFCKGEVTHLKPSTLCLLSICIITATPSLWSLYKCPFQFVVKRLINSRTCLILERPHLMQLLPVIVDTKHFTVLPTKESTNQQFIKDHIKVA